MRDRVGLRRPRRGDRVADHEPDPGWQGPEESQALSNREEPASALRGLPMSKTLIVGARGMLGRALRELLTARGETFDGVDLPEFDLTNQAQVEATLQQPYKAVLNCAAYTNVDGAETDEAAATRANGEGVRIL